MTPKKIILLVCMWCSFTATHAQTDSSGIVLLEQMVSAIDALHTCQFEMHAKERIDNTYVFTHSVASINYQPRQIFLRTFDAEDKLKNEILYIQGQNDNEALIASLGFPFINLNLDPLGNTMRNKKHLTILEAGGKFLGEMIAQGIPAMKKNLNTSVLVTSKEVKKANADFYQLTIKNLDYTFKLVETGSQKSLHQLCLQLGVPEYKVLQINDEIDNFNDDISHQSILVPNYYSKEIHILIRAKDFMPISVQLFDEKGLFSSYEYDYFKVDPVINEAVFDKNNPAYTF